MGNNITKLIIEAINGAGIEIVNGDVLLVADKIVATSEGRVVKLKSIHPTKKAEKLAKKYSLEPQFVELVLREADEIYGGVPRALATLKNNVLIANAGIDHKNAPENSACLWPANPNETTKKIWKALSEETKRRIGVILVDSRVNPLRLGTTGFALGIAGIRPIRDCRGMVDLYGRRILITRVNVCDDLAAAAHLVMGEAAERTPLVVVRGAPVELTDQYDPDEMIIEKNECLYMRLLSKKKLGVKKVNALRRQEYT